MKEIASDVVIIIILWISIAASLFLNFNYDFPFIFGVIGLLIVTIIHNRFPNYSFGLLALLLFLSIFNVVSFCYALQVNFMIFNAPGTILFAVLFFTQIRRFIELNRNWSGDDSDSKEDSDRKIQPFKQQFQNLSESDLCKKLRNNQLIKEAKIAASELLTEKFK